MIYNYIAETEPLLTEDKADAVCICRLCGRMYKERPFLCLCKSNVFLRDAKQVLDHDVRGDDDA